MDLPMLNPEDADWLHQGGARLLKWWPAKMIGTPLGIAAFLGAYFWLLRNPLHPPFIMPMTGVDRLIGFWPQALVLYVSFWFYISLAPALLKDRRELISYGLAAAGLGAIALGIFFFWPTAVPPCEIDWTQHPAFAVLKSVDSSGNACPSLHVAFTVFTSVWIDRLLKRMGARWHVRTLNWLWGLGILYSTLATRQHVFLDVLAGGALGATVGLVHFRLLRIFPAPSATPSE
jgi:membrane-associated phospholipid phosphatase